MEELAMGDLRILMNDGIILIFDDVDEEVGNDWVAALSNDGEDEYYEGSPGWWDINKANIVAIEWTLYGEDLVLK